MREFVELVIAYPHVSIAVCVGIVFGLSYISYRMFDYIVGQAEKYDK